MNQLHNSIFRRLFVGCFMGLLLVIGGNLTAQPVQPANPDLSEEARQLLQFLDRISGTYTLAGQQNFNDNLDRWDEEVKKITGSYPVVWGADFSYNFDDKSHDEVRQKLVDMAKKKYREGHIITLMWHACPPDEGHTCASDSIWVWNDMYPQSKWYQFTTPGTELNKKWRSQVDNVAKYLKQLKDAGIPVLWRPYHEMNGMWFWWCQHPGEQGFERLWKRMYDRLVNYHELNNLIWVWNPNAPRDIEGDHAFPYEHYFPGLDYVDVLAADVYYNDYRKSHHDQLLELADEKPIGLGEVGQLPTPKVLKQQPQWTWFMEWGDWLKKKNDTTAIKELYEASSVVTLDEIERNEQEEYEITIK